ncbi:MAG: LysR family transcriptional regulator [Colwellia sp.]|nr:LysR family transcriptional regulator [Colwellia sp.]
MNNLEQKLSRIDLNLLVSLNVLLNVKSVSKAAKVLFISQPAMSKTLHRLRELFDDPLFYRTSNGLVPSAKANELQQSLPGILNNLNGLFQEKHFDPATCKQNITISIPSVLGHSILLPLVSMLTKTAPHICIIDYPTEADPFPALETGKYDFAIHVTKPPNNQYISTALGSVKPRIYARKAHPLVNEGLINTSQLKKYKFIYFQVAGDESSGFISPAESIVKKLNFSPEVVAKSSHLSILMALLAKQDYLMIAPDSLMNIDEFSSQFQCIYPFEVQDSVELLLLESVRIKDSPAEQWLKDQLLASVLSENVKV